jgi:hypothetical protein
VNAPLHFKQQLADELNVRAVALSAAAAPAAHLAEERRPSPRRRLTFTAGAAAAAAAAVAIVVAVSSGTQSTQGGTQQAAPARQGAAGGDASAASTPQGTSGTGLDIVNADYAVNSAPGSTVSVALFTPRGVAGLQSDLRKAGVPAVVMAPSTSCHATIDHDRSGGSSAAKVMPPGSTHRGSDGTIYHEINPGAIPKGDHLLLIARFTPGQAQALADTLVRQVPSCVPSA